MKRKTKRRRKRGPYNVKPRVLRDRTVSFKCSPETALDIERAAAATGQTVSTYLADWWKGHPETMRRLAQQEEAMEEFKAREREREKEDRARYQELALRIDARLEEIERSIRRLAPPQEPESPSADEEDPPGPRRLAPKEAS